MPIFSGTMLIPLVPITLLIYVAFASYVWGVLKADKIEWDMRGFGVGIAACLVSTALVGLCLAGLCR